MWGGHATRRADRLRARSDYEPGVLNGNGDKPKWMRWHTFYRLTEAHDRLVNRSMHAVALKFGLLRSAFPE